jgi:hypothetical protein
MGSIWTPFREYDGIILDYSRQRATSCTFKFLLALAKVCITMTLFLCHRFSKKWSTFASLLIFNKSNQFWQMWVLHHLMSLWKCVTQMCIFSGLSFFPDCRKRELRRRLTWCFKGNMYCLFEILCWKPLLQFCSSYLTEPLNPNPNMTSFRKDVYLKKMWLDQCASIMALECQATLELQIRTNLAQLVISISHWWLEEWW